MKKRRTGVSRFTLLALLLGAVLAPVNLQAQTSTEVRDRLMWHFDIVMRKFSALAEAMPAETYSWSPGEGVMEVGQVYMHVAHYNYLYPSQSLGMALPESVEMEGMETIRDKDRIQDALAQSHAWVLEQVRAMSAQELEAEAQLYGQTVTGWTVLTQLVTHMSEHLGQSIAYARMNGVVPPWSR